MRNYIHTRAFTYTKGHTKREYQKYSYFPDKNQVQELASMSISKVNNLCPLHPL